MENFPSSIRPYLDEIAQCLWSKNASIMIGAGFSMNAKPMFDNAKRFPSWQDLGNVFYKKVRGEEIKDAKYNFFDPLKLAYEVESNFGRSVLDSILRTNIPDSDYKPSELHQILLSLPWTDVFTTNYDTMLERAAESVSERNYKVIVHKDNLVHSTPPRIVKLHGCFSASTPLIISEEDYRTYPQKYAPFVNTVQQTLLENTLCLIGFSGDDPNFLKWIGWIRDNLGAQNAPKIYLIGVLNLSTSQEKALAQYNITCVDMSLCEGVNEHDHTGGIKKFINYCESRKEDESQKGWELSNKLIHSRYNSTNVPTDDDILNEFTELIELWKKERTSYPNWLIVPNELRRKLWAYTKNWSSAFDKEIPIPTSLLKNFIYEFLWRKEKSLLPIFDNEVSLIKSSINHDFSDDNGGNKQTLYIALALLRYYREEGKKEDWINLFDTVSDYFNGQNNSDYLIYERALYLLIDNKSVELTQLLSRWSAGNSSAIWMYRKASILAEINKLTDAQDILEKVLIKTRRKINASTSVIDYANVSLESYILVLLTNVNRALSIKEGDFLAKVKQDYVERLNELRQFQCNPWQEIQLLELEVKHEPTRLKSISVTNGFDIGSQHTTHHFSGENTEALNAFRLLRFFEDASLPFSLPRMNIAVAGANNAIKRVATYAPFWSMSTMLRTRSKKSTELIFTRASLSRLDTAFIDRLAINYIELLRTFVNEGDSLYEYGSMLPEALSRLCCRVTLDVKDELLNLIGKIYSNQPTRHKYQSLDELIRRLILSYSDKEIIQRLGQITDIAYYVVANNGKEVNPYTCPNPFKYFLDLVVPDFKNKKPEVKLSTDKIKLFLNAMESDNTAVRQNASLTLIRLKHLGFLNKNQEKSLSSKLLSHKDEHGLPINTGYYKFAYIELFDGKSEVKAALRNYILNATPLIPGNTSPPNTVDSGTFANELIGSNRFMNWSDKELQIHAKKLINWWQSDKATFEGSGNNSEFIKEIKNRVTLFVECIDVIVIQNNLTEFKDTISKIVSEFQELELDYLCLKAAAINYIDFDKTEFINEIEGALSTFEDQQVLDALWAMHRLLGKSDKTNAIYFNILATFINYSRGQYLTNAFQVVINILEDKSSTLNPKLESSVLNALSKVINGFEQLNFEENLALKKIAAGLANELITYYIVSDNSIPPVITAWKKLCDSTDEFAEIKNQWKS